VEDTPQGSSFWMCGAEQHPECFEQAASGGGRDVAGGVDCHGEGGGAPSPPQVLRGYTLVSYDKPAKHQSDSNEKKGAEPK